MVSCCLREEAEDCRLVSWGDGGREFRSGAMVAWTGDGQALLETASSWSHEKMARTLRAAIAENKSSFCGGSESSSIACEAPLWYFVRVLVLPPICPKAGNVLFV